MSFIVRVYTPAYALEGRSESTNAFLGWLNNPNKRTLDLFEVQGLSLDPSATLASFSQPQVTVPKNRILAVDMVSTQAQSSVQLPSRAVLAVLYTERFVIQANVHASGDMPISNVFNVVGGDFLAVSDAKLHPIIPTRKLPTDYAHVLVLSKLFVNFYHPRV
jgi:hypothetical protein